MFRSVFTKVQKSFDLQPLQDLATMRVAILVCETKDMQDAVRAFPKSVSAFSCYGEQWRRLRSRGDKKLHQIGVPGRIVNIVLEKLWSISYEIFKWINYHAEDTDIDCSFAFVWTPRFAIDYVKTAKILIKNEKMDMKMRFKIACLYCFEEDKRSLWRRMSLSERRIFFVRGNSKKSDQNLIVLYWTYYIQEVPVDYWACKILLNHIKLYKHSVKNGYLTATTYFFNKLNGRARSRVISENIRFYIPIRLRPELDARDRLAISWFLIFQVRSDVHWSNFCYIFLYFLEWPWQKHFMTVVNRVRSRISQYSFEKLLEAIFEKEMAGFQDHDYQELFMEFWLQSPESCKTYVNTALEIGCHMITRFVGMHFRFVFEEEAFSLKKKFRDIVFERKGSENAQHFEPKNVEFFKFLVRAQVATRATLQRFGFRFPLGELLYLVDGLMGIV